MQREEVRVVLVEDEPDTSATLAWLLEDDGYSVRIAGSIAEAHLIVEEHRPICVLLDLGLPDGDGCDLASRLRERYGAELVIIAVTGRVDQASRDAAELAGIDFVLAKPVDQKDFRKLLPPLGNR